jgi:hypothetical protein
MATCFFILVLSAILKEVQNKEKHSLVQGFFLNIQQLQKEFQSQNCKPVFPLTSSEIETNRLNAVRFPLINKLFKPLNYSSKLGVDCSEFGERYFSSKWLE